MWKLYLFDDKATNGATLYFPANPGFRVSCTFSTNLLFDCNKTKTKPDEKQQVTVTAFTLNCNVKCGRCESDSVASASRQVPDRGSQSAGGRLPQSGHAAPWSSAGSSTRRLLQWRVGRQGQRFSVGLLTSTVHTQPGLRRQRSPAGPVESLSPSEEVRPRTMSWSLNFQYWQQLLVLCLNLDVYIL